MARLKYDEVVVEQVISELGNARNNFASNTSGLASAMSVIMNARGAQYLDVSALEAAPKASNTCAEQVDQMIQSIRARVEEIKVYNADIESMGWGKRLLSTVGLGVAKLGEGVLTAGEQLVDGFASALGWVGGLFSSSFRDKIGEFVKKDYIGDAFHNFYYNTDFGKEMTKASYISENGTVAKVVKVFGTAIGYALAVAATGGIAGVAGGGSFAAGAAAARGSLAFAAGAAGIGGVGLGTQTGLQSGMTYNKAFANGIKTGAIAAATVVAVNYALKGASALFNKWKASRAAGNSGKPGTDLTPYDNPTGPKGSGGSGGGGGGGSTGPSGTGPVGGASQSVDDLLNNFDDLNNMTDWNLRKELLKGLQDKGNISKEQFEAFMKNYKNFVRVNHPDLSAAAAKEGTSDAATKAVEAATSKAGEAATSKAASNTLTNSVKGNGVKLLTDGSSSSASNGVGKVVGDQIDDTLKFFSDNTYSAAQNQEMFKEFAKQIQGGGVKLSPEQLAKFTELQKSFGLGSTGGNTLGSAAAKTTQSVSTSASNGLGNVTPSGVSGTSSSGLGSTLKTTLGNSVDDTLHAGGTSLDDFISGKVDLGTSSGGVGATPQPMRSPLGDTLKATETLFKERNPLIDLFEMPKVAPEAGVLVPVDSALSSVASGTTTSLATGAGKVADTLVAAASKAGESVVGGAAGAAAGAAGSAAGSAAASLGTGAATKLAGLLPGVVSETVAKVAPSVLEHVATEAAGETAAQLANVVKPAPVATVEAKPVTLPKLALSEVEKVETVVPQTQLQVYPKADTGIETAVQAQPKQVQTIPAAVQPATQSSAPPYVPPSVQTATGTQYPSPQKLPAAATEENPKVIVPLITDTPTGGGPPVDGGGNDSGGVVDGGGTDTPVVPPGDDPPGGDNVPPDTSGNDPVSGGGDPTSGGGTPSGGGGSPSGGSGYTPSGGSSYTPSGGSNYTPTGSDYSNSSTNTPTGNESTASDIVNKTANEVGGQGGGGNEYTAIPDTGVGGNDGWKDYIMPTTIGLTAGLIGLGASSLHKKKEESDEQEEYDEYEEIDEVSDEHFDSSILDDYIE